MDDDIRRENEILRQEITRLRMDALECLGRYNRAKKILEGQNIDNKERYAEALYIAT